LIVKAVWVIGLTDRHARGLVMVMPRMLKPFGHGQSMGALQANVKMLGVH